MLARLAILCPCAAFCASTVLQSEAVHLRSGAEREWRSFPALARGPELSLKFNGQPNQRQYSLVLRQRDVKALWTVWLNNTELGTLIQDERDMLRLLPVPAGALKAGSNQIRVVSKQGAFSDDIEIRDIRLQHSNPAALQQQTTLEVAVTSESGALPVRITVVDDQGSLVPIRSLRPEAYEATRIGVVYTADGLARLGLPTGAYRVYASRGFEYNAPSTFVRLTRPGQRVAVTLKLRREVNLTGFASCDTHVHTLELSGHGDASVDERVLTAAGEGLDLIVATEHNRFSDYSPAVRGRALDKSVNSIAGTEVTTSVGHFNVFPTDPGARYPNPAERDWTKLREDIQKIASAGVVVQNHPRDLHSGYRPFDPAHHVARTGQNLNGRPFSASAMEVVNSGAMAPDPMQLVHDWMGLLTRGEPVAAVGASDTHTVDFVPIGQARTYIDVTSLRDWRRNPNGVAARLVAGENLVSYGLAADARQTGPIRNGRVPVEVQVWGPSWAAADKLTIYSNGTPVWSKSLRLNRQPGRKFHATLPISVPAHDTTLVAVVTGPAVTEPFWEVRKPYQPTSPDWTPMILGVSRALWIDSDGSGKRESPLHHARVLVQRYKGDSSALKRALTGYDESVAMHVQGLL